MLEAQEWRVQPHLIPHKKYLSLVKGTQVTKIGERPTRFKVRVGHLKKEGLRWVASWTEGLWSKPSLPAQGRPPVR